MKKVPKVKTVDSVIHTKELTQNDLPLGYDNAVWLFYASNYHGGVHILCRGFDKTNPINNIDLVTIEPQLIMTNRKHDTIELVIVPALMKTDSCKYIIGQFYKYVEFGFKENSDTVIYRGIDGAITYRSLRKNMWNRCDSVKITKIKSNLFDSLKKSKSYKTMKFNGPIYAFDRARGEYPIDEQDSLFRIYLKEHEKELAPTLRRICKQKGIL